MYMHFLCVLSPLFLPLLLQRWKWKFIEIVHMNFSCFSHNLPPLKDLFFFHSSGMLILMMFYNSVTSYQYWMITINNLWLGLPCN